MPRVAAESVTVTPVKVTLPVLVTTMLYVIVLPTTYGPVEVWLFTTLKAGFGVKLTVTVLVLGGVSLLSAVAVLV